MILDKFETTILKDALLEYWHSNIKHSKNDDLKQKFKFLLEDFKTMQQAKGKQFTITLNK